MTKLKDLFKPKYGVNLELDKCDQATGPGTINFVARTSQNNGVVARVKMIDGVIPQPAGTLSCAVSGSVLSCFVQNEPYYSGRDLYVLTPKVEMSHIVKLFYAHAIMMNAYRYSYGRAANKTMPLLNLPDLEDAVKFAERFSELDSSTKLEPVSPAFASNFLKTRKWGTFKLSQLFFVSGTKTTPLDDLIEIGPGPFPYITTQAVNNGVAGFFNAKTEKGKVLTIDSAVAGYCSYQDEDFTASDHVEKLTPKDFALNKYTGLFIATIINQNQYRYSYGRKMNQIKIRDTIITLPINNDGKPDWQAIEDFMKKLPYSDRI